ncbi:HCMVIRL14 [Human betaherpesvirus 5]|uniref:Uncharacterized protein IRL14 n=1 Tax=Human cytomegalovirus (strain AD169) TaxID=10360 RepID=IR14_HCMVA|nr:RecName: Full=Uncharacterized protein IRL14 [Human herpesvirus 5 strain AD169]CAA35296.1 HCMVIRL14 [Human betaherpesvirus 5]
MRPQLRGNQRNRIRWWQHNSKKCNQTEKWHNVDWISKQPLRGRTRRDRLLHELDAASQSDPLPGGDGLTGGDSKATRRTSPRYYPPSEATAGRWPVDRFLRVPLQRAPDPRLRTIHPVTESALARKSRGLAGVTRQIHRAVPQHIADYNDGGDMGSRFDNLPGVAASVEACGNHVLVTRRSRT